MRTNKSITLLSLIWLPALAIASQPPDACALLSPDAIRQATGEPLVSTKPTAQVARGVRQSQCFYTLPTFTNSISVTLVGPAGSPRDAARELWESWFHRDRDRDAKPGSEEEEAAAKAVPVPGLGDEAYWVQSFVGNLYVRKGGQFLRISLGGKAADADRRTTAAALATQALRRLR